MQAMTRTIEIKIKVKGTNDEIKECMREMLKEGFSPVVVEMSFRTLDTYQGKWTEYAIVKAAGKIVKSPLDGFIRKSRRQKE
jgi:2-phosphoglycerate kinase